MCTSIDIKDANDIWQSLGSVKKLKEFGFIVQDIHWRDFDDRDGDDDVCLCCVDVESVLNDNNLSYVKDSIGDYVVDE